MKYYPKKKKKAQNGFEALQKPNVNRDELLKDVGQVKDPTISTPPELLTYGIKNNKFDWNKAAKTFNAGLLAFNALIPPEKPPIPVVQPLDSYNPNPYGTGSQAIANYGTKISNTGYKNTSPDKNASQLMIPSNRITMKDVQMPVFGQDNLGYSQMMMPNQEYKFPGKYVTETPMKAQNGATFQNPQQIYQANQIAKSLSKKKGLVSGENAYVAQNVGDAVPQYTGSGNTAIPASMINKQVPSYVKSLEWNQEANLPYYIDEQTGYMQYASPENFYNPKYRKPQEQQTMDMASMRMTKGGDISPEKARKILHDGTIRGKKITEKQRRFFGAKSNKAENGLQIEGGYKPISPNMIELTGDSHAEGGQDLKYGNVDVEAEGGEPISMNNDKSITVFGNLQVPGTNKKFKTVAKDIAKKQTKSVEIAEKGLELINSNSPYDKGGKFKFNAGKIMLIGGKKKYEELTALTEHLSDLQGASLEADNGGGNMMSPLKKQGSYEAKNGLTIAQNGGKYRYVDTKTEKLDDKIKGFVELLKQKGYSGYSGPESGVSQRNTKSGRRSRHASGEALDAFLETPNAYNKVLKDAELSKYLIDNGLTVINEYDPKTKEKTGATAGHLHIGYDRGTGISDQFRKDAASLYQKTNPTWGWGTTRAPGRNSPMKGAISGDAQFNFQSEGFDKQPFTYKPKDKQPINNPEYKGKFQFTEPSPRPIPSNAEGLELTQILPELYTAATNQVDPVHMQQFTPELYQPYQVSFQDRLNQNQGTFAATSQYLQDNPEALSTLAGQKYSADSQVLADEFRTNQQIANEITNKNTDLLNEAELKNLQLADIQYTRQTQAKSNTKAQNYNILDSISNKLLQRQRDNRELQIYENLYDFRFDKETGRKSYEGVSGDKLVNYQDVGTINPAIPTNPIPQLNQYQSFNQKIDKFGNPAGGNIRTPSLQDQLSKKISLSRYSKIGGSKKIADLLQQKYAYEALYP